MNRLVRRSLFGLFVAACITAFPVQAAAEQIKYNSNASLTTLVTVGGSNAANYHGQVRAGALNWTWVGTPPTGYAESFYSFCVDLANLVQSTQTVTLESSAGFTNGVANGGAKVAWLFNEFAAGILSMADLTQAAISAAALQVAIWEAMYDTTRNLTGGAFTVSGPSEVINQANYYLKALYNSDMDSVATILNTKGGQDQIVAQVSEPSTLLLMGLAFFAFAMLARRPVVTTTT